MRDEWSPDEHSEPYRGRINEEKRLFVAPAQQGRLRRSHGGCELPDCRLGSANVCTGVLCEAVVSLLSADDDEYVHEDGDDHDDDDGPNDDVLFFVYCGCELGCGAWIVVVVWGSGSGSCCCDCVFLLLPLLLWLLLPLLLL